MQGNAAATVVPELGGSLLRLIDAALWHLTRTLPLPNHNLQHPAVLEALPTSFGLSKGRPPEVHVTTFLLRLAATRLDCFWPYATGWRCDHVSAGDLGCRVPGERLPAD